MILCSHMVLMRSEQVLRKCGKASPEYRALEKLTRSRTLALQVVLPRHAFPYESHRWY